MLAMHKKLGDITSDIGTLQYDVEKLRFTLEDIHDRVTPTNADRPEFEQAMTALYEQPHISTGLGIIFDYVSHIEEILNRLDTVSEELWKASKEDTTSNGKQEEPGASNK